MITLIQKFKENRLYCINSDKYNEIKSDTYNGQSIAAEMTPEDFSNGVCYEFIKDQAVEVPVELADYFLSINSKNTRNQYCFRLCEVGSDDEIDWNALVNDENNDVYDYDYIPPIWLQGE